jgi:hypothetical protein
VAQGGCLKNILERFAEDIAKYKGKIPRTPGTLAAFAKEKRVGEEVRLSEKDTKKFQSMIMSAMFVARLTRIDLLFWFSYLATKCAAPTVADMLDCIRGLVYMKDKGNWGIRYKNGVRVKISVWADSSHTLHKDSKGHMGLVISLGSGFVHIKSVKLKITTLSSTESEFCCMTEASCYVRWLRSFIATLGFKAHKRPIPVVYEDNMSGIWYARHGLTFARNKHLMIKRNFPMEGNAEGIPTRQQDADGLTKVKSYMAQDKIMKEVGMELLNY